MQKDMQKDVNIVQVQTSKPYNIYIGNNLDFQCILRKYIANNVVLFLDANTPRNILEAIQNAITKLNIPFQVITFRMAGEGVKSFTHFEEISKQLIAIGANRKSVFIAVGGGTVGDFVGFLASTFMRGTPFIQIPTTLLSMVDSSVGGKVAINLDSYKNCIGAFLQPKAVLIDISFLQTLPQVELASGYAEVIKYGFIKSRDFLEYLLQNEDIFASFIHDHHLSEKSAVYITKIIAKSCHIKAEVVAQDEEETTGVREILNFGHTFAHAFEGTLLGKIPHGIAVGIGIVYACRVSGIDVTPFIAHYKKIGLFSSIGEFCQAYNLQKPSAISLLQFMQKDKKNDDASIKLILLNEVESVKTEKLSSSKVLEILEGLLGM